MWEELMLDQPASITFPDATPAIITYYSQHVRGESLGNVHVSIPGKPALDLVDAVDDGETVDEPRIHAVFGDVLDEVFLFGGPKAYLVGSLSTINEVVATYRERKFEEYWYTTLVDTPAGTVLVYESGCLLLDANLQVRWHIEKQFNDFFDRVTENELEFLCDHEQRWSVALEDGRITGLGDT